MEVSLLNCSFEDISRYVLEWQFYQPFCKKAFLEGVAKRAKNDVGGVSRFAEIISGLRRRRNLGISGFGGTQETCEGEIWR